MAEPTRAQSPVAVEAAGDTHIGGRPHNEDAILLRPDLSLFVVADGAGGKNAGNVASSLAVTTIAHFFEQTEARAADLPLRDGLGLYTAARRLATAVQEANKEIMTVAKSSDRHRGMGTTIVATVVDAKHGLLHLAYVGDSRCYRLREGRLELLTFDHSLINDVLELRPNIDDARVKKLPKNVITRALGMSDNLRVSMRSHDLLAGDRFLLCSDGLSDVVTEATILEVLGDDEGPDTRVERFVDLALNRGAEDNIAIIVVDAAPAEGEGGTRQAVRVVRRASRPQMPRVVAGPAPDQITEESVPEIVLYGRNPEADRESSPLIHVVPAASQSPEVVEAVQGVMGRDVEDEESSLDDGGEAKRDTTPGLAPLPQKAKDIKLPPPPQARAGKNGAAKMPSAKRSTPGRPRAAFASATGAGPKPDGRYSGIADEASVDDEAPTMVADVSPSVEEATLAFRAKMEAKRAREAKKTSLAAPRRHKPDASTLDARDARTGDTQRALESAPPPALRPSSPGDDDEEAPSPSDDGKSQGTALSQARRAPEPPHPRQMSGTIPGTPPPLDVARRQVEEERRQRQAEAAKAAAEPPEKLAVPPMRPPLDTSELILDESIPCHACNSIISRRAEICMYCGATTGFVVGDD